MRRFILTVYLYIRSFFGTKIEGVDTVQDKGAVPSTWIKRQKQNLWDLYNQDIEDRIDYTNTHHHHFSNFNHLDDVSHPDFHRIAEQVGLTYEEDGKTPLNAAAVFDMTYEQYEEYKKKILPQAKDRKITMEEIEELFN